ncbi:MAG TPA: hypothetical protein VK966_00445, partial [Longimicrobiales bacterium]|nr:hypothetical protein [Longimicrobiales bacterium]
MTVRHRLTALVVPVVLIASPAGAQEVPNGGDTPPAHAASMLFETSDRCLACHNGVTTSTGRDVSIGFDWRGSMMANSARDPYWHAAVRREIMDHPQEQTAIEDTCSTCHMPMARYEAHLRGERGEVFGNLPAVDAATRREQLAADGVSCAMCHQITEEGLGEPESFTGGFVVDETTPWGHRSMLGPFVTDSGRALLMRSAT